MADRWRVEHRRGSAQRLHDLDPAGIDHATVWIFEPVGTALVLGSTQRDLRLAPDVAEGAAIEVAHRRSGGGVVLVDPSRTLWIDLVIPRSHPLWLDDVGGAMHWVGETWARALGTLGFEVGVHRGRVEPGPWGRMVCFAGLGPGEVLDGGSRKVVGISQRRTRDTCRFQSVAYLHEVPGGLSRLLGLDSTAGRALDEHMSVRTGALPFARNVVTEAFIAALPAV